MYIKVKKKKRVIEGLIFVKNWKKKKKKELVPAEPQRL